ncbi:MAG: transcriptional repressor [Lentisphaerae bacterium]|nr:transcriptional repressor [Lentisphaerota bacterium]
MVTLKDFQSLCLEKGLRATQQRYQIYKILAGTTSHPGAAEVFEQAKATQPMLSFDTVYRTLGAFVEKGIISQVEILAGKVRFDGNPHPHPHAICTECDKVVDCHHISNPQPKDYPNVPGFASVSSAHLELRGVCQECAAKSAPRQAVAK